MKVSELYDDLKRFEEILETAETNASTGREIDFVSDTQERYGEYGGSMNLSHAQDEWLRRLARV